MKIKKIVIQKRPLPRTKPKTATVHAEPVEAFNEETQTRIKQQRLEDRWQPVVRLYLSMSRIITYTDERAQSIWRDFCAGVYAKKKQQGS